MNYQNSISGGAQSNGSVAVRSSQTESQIQTLRNRSETLRKLVTALESRCSKVLQEVPQDPANKAEPQEILVPLAGEIRDVNNELRITAEIADRILSNIEL